MNSKAPFTRHADDRLVTAPTPFRKTFSGFVAGLINGFLCSTFVLTAILVVFFAFSDLRQTFGDDSVLTQTPPRPIGEMRKDVEAFLKNSKSDDDLDLQVGGIVDLCYMHQEIVTDPRFDSNRQLQSIRAVAAARLKKYLKTIEVEKARKARRLKKEQAAANRKLLSGEPAELPPVVDTKPHEANPLSAPVNLAQHSQIVEDSESSDDKALNEAMYGSMSSLGSLTGGPSQMFGYLSGNFAPPWDHGEELVALIESTINPEFWKRNGGSGIIYYYRPSRIIIVGATSQIHDDMTNMLRNMRRLSR